VLINTGKNFNSGKHQSIYIKSFMKSVSQTRLHVVDALRGFAIVSIMLLHNLEHFDFYFQPSGLPDWMQALDKVIWDSLFFLFAGKSYAIFALLFGLTFYLQSERQAQIGKNFSARFAWRMLLLLGFGIINSAFYQGDILTLYAVIGVLLIPFYRLSTKWVLITAIILMLQPFEWIHLFRAFEHPDKLMSDPVSWTYFGKMESYITGSSFLATVAGNLSNGKYAVILWTWENGRVLQTLSLFLLGMLAGRKQLFDLNHSTLIFWKKVIIVSFSAFLPLYYFKQHAADFTTREAVLRPIQTLLTSWTNMAFLGILVAGFVLLFAAKSPQKLLKGFSPIGRMSLSNYIFQSILGSFIYYGFGLSMYKYTGATYSLLIGLSLAILQGIFSSWWMKNNRQGPLETLWHRATWMSLKRAQQR